VVPVPVPITIAEALRWPGLEPVDARVLLQHVLGVGHAYLIAHSERVLTSSETEAASSLFFRRLQGEPVAYLIGRREFFGRDFFVSPAVLIPRPETELLVEMALERIASLARPRVLDLGTGSGCVALTLAQERINASITAVDISDAALRVAQANRQKLTAANVEFLIGRWFDALGERRFDIIVGNPPYVSSGDPHLETGDVRFEPRAALAAGPDGLNDLTHIITAAQDHLAPGGWLLLEHGWDQADAVAALLTDAGFEEAFLARDLAGQPRVSGGRAPGTPARSDATTHRGEHPAGSFP
jgi:release factor glutamine methyltransferase